MLKLKQVMDANRLTTGVLAAEAGISRSAMSQIINNNVWPKATPKPVITQCIQVFLAARDIDSARCFEEVEPGCSNSPAPITNEGEANEGVNMILRKQRLSAEAKEHFGLARDPFGQDPNCPEDVFMTQNTREILADMESAVLNGRFIAVCGESGSGKSTLLELLEEQLRGQNVKIIRPYILGMEDNDREGKTLRVAHIEEAIIRTIDPTTKIKRTSEGRAHQMHELLKSAGRPCALVIEEAHSLPIPTLKHFKRLRELKDGQRQLLGVLLVGQPELEDKLGTGKKEVREVVQRCELTHLQHLGKHLAAYIEHRFQRARLGSADRIFDAEAFAAFAPRLQDVISQQVRKGDQVSTIKTATPMLYPLAVGNLAISAMNMAASLGAPKVTADAVWRA